MEDVINEWYDINTEATEIDPIRKEYFETDPEPEFTLLMFASMKGYDKLISALLRSGEKLNERCNKGLTALGYAVTSGHFECVKVLVINGADVSCVDNNGDMPLMLAARQGYDNIARYLLTVLKSKKIFTTLHKAASSSDLHCLHVLIKADINVNITNRDGQTVLMTAAAEGHIEAVRCLLSAKANVNIQCNKGKTALSYAADQGHLPCVQHLLTSGSDLNLADKEGHTPLMRAAMHNHTKIINSLMIHLDKDEDLNVRCKQGKTAFFYAAQYGHLDCVKIFMRRGPIDVNITDNDFQTPLATAIQQNHRETVQYLLFRGAQCDAAAKDGTYPIHCAAAVGNLDMLQNLLLEGTGQIQDVINLQDSHGKTLLMIAAENRHENIVNYLLSIKADTRAHCDKSWTALHYAAYGARMSCIKRLVRANRDMIDAQTKDGLTCLMISCSKGNYSIVALLISLEADLNVQCKTGKCALHYAVMRGSTKCVEALLAAGPRVTLKDKNGNTPLILARHMRRRRAVELFQRHGATQELPLLRVEEGITGKSLPVYKVARS